MADDGGDDERNRRFDLERRVQAGRLTRIHQDTNAEVTRLLKEAHNQITAELAASPGDFDAFILPRVQQSIRRVLAEAGDDLSDLAGAGATKAWDVGVDMIDKPIEAGGVRIAGLLTEVDRSQLIAMRAFLTDRMKNVATEAANRINGELAQVLIGLQTSSEAAGKIAGLINEGGRARALTITHTEVGRAFSVAGQARLDQARERLPGLRKMWRRSGKLHSRIAHDVADGQIRKSDEPFDVGGEQLMFPRDPKASAKNTVRCGCVSLPHMADWEVSHPGRKPFTDDELAGDENKRRLAGVQAQAFDTWVKRLGGRRAHAVGHWEQAGALTADLHTSLEARGISPATLEVAISDRRIQHMLRDAKAGRGAALPVREVRRLPEHLANPKAVLWDSGAARPTLIYVFEAPGEKRLGKFPVRIRDRDPRAGQRRHNWVVSGGLIDRDALANNHRYEILAGGI